MCFSTTVEPMAKIWPVNHQVASADGFFKVVVLLLMIHCLLLLQLFVAFLCLVLVL